LFATIGRIGLSRPARSHSSPDGVDRRRTAQVSFGMIGDRSGPSTSDRDLRSPVWQTHRHGRDDPETTGYSTISNGPPPSKTRHSPGQNVSNGPIWAPFRTAVKRQGPSCRTIVTPQRATPTTFFVQGRQPSTFSILRWIAVYV